MKYNQTVVDGPSSEHADLIFHTLGDATRRAIFQVALRDERSVSELARRYPMSFAAVQKHVAVRERAWLVTKRRRGREQLVSGSAQTVRPARRLLDQLEAVWRERMDGIDAILTDETEGASPCP